MIPVPLLLLAAGFGGQDSEASRTPIPAESMPAAPRFHWADFDGNGIQDRLEITASRHLSLLWNAGGQRVQPAGPEAGLDSLAQVAFVLVGDYDADGRFDLFVAGLDGAQHLLRNKGWSFEDVSGLLHREGLGTLGCEPLVFGCWQDRNDDGALDLVLQDANTWQLWTAQPGAGFRCQVLSADAVRDLPRTWASRAIAGKGAPAGAQWLESQPYQLLPEDLVRWDNARLKIQPDPMAILDAPPRIDKRDFRALPSNDYAPGQLLLRLVPGHSESALERLLALVAPAELDWTSEMVPDLHRIRFEGQLEWRLHALLDDGEILYAEPAWLAHSTQNPNDPFYIGGNLWGLQGNFGSKAYLAWDEFTGGSAATIAIIDTGTQTNHPDLQDNIWTNPGEIPGNGIDDDFNGHIDDVHGWNVAQNNGDVDSCGENHGTHVAGTVGARGNDNLGVVGVNWNCRLMILRCNGPASCDPDNTGTISPHPCCGLYNTVQALDYAMANGARVSNNSYGSHLYSQSQHDMILAGQSVGHVFVAAAGNDGFNNDLLPVFPASHPLSNIIAVAAHDSDGDLGSFSNYGPNSVDLSAPGVDITSTIVSGWASGWNGTSMAAPHVAGAAGLVLNRYPELSWQQIRERILGGATPTPSIGTLVQTEGILNVLNSLGLWVQPGSLPAGNPGSKNSPLAALETIVAIARTPEESQLNFHPGTILLTDLLGVSLLTKPMVLSSTGGPTLIGD
ncbi:MAG: S8 family serine peptidase [Planctomycetota bacterium]